MSSHTIKCEGSTYAPHECLDLADHHIKTIIDEGRSAGWPDPPLFDLFDFAYDIVASAISKELHTTVHYRGEQGHLEAPETTSRNPHLLVVTVRYFSPTNAADCDNKYRELQYHCAKSTETESD